MAHFALVHPPMANPYAPYLSVPELTAHLRRTGHRITPLDLNVEAHDFLLTRPELERAFEPLVRRFERLERRSRLLTPEEQQEYARLAGPIARREYLCAQIDRVVCELHDPALYSFDERGESRQALNWSLFMQARQLLFASRVFNPFLYEGYDGGISCFMSTAHLLGAVEAREEAPIHRYYRMLVLPRLRALRPDLVGISWSFAEQTMPTILLAALIKGEIPGTRVVLGGNIPSLLHQELADAVPLHSFIDGFVVGDGEPALRAMAAQLDAGRWCPPEIPNLRYLSRGSVEASPQQERWRQLNDDPPPDFDGLPLDRYYVGTRQLAYMTGRGCYYNRCKFCNFPTTNPGYLGRSPEKVAADLEYLAQRYQTRLFYVADDAVAPAKIYKIAVEILKRGLDITWWALTRFDPGWDPERLEVIKESGCYRLFFGGESAEDRLQEYTDKGFTSARIREVLRMMQDTSLHVHMSTIVGFPTETPAESEHTISMVKEETRRLRFSGRVHLFRLTAYSGLALDPSSGVQPLRHPLNELAVNYAYYRVGPGSVREMLAAKERAKTLIDEFNREERREPLHCYPETHTYEGLQFFANYRGEIPHVQRSASTVNWHQRTLRIAPWVSACEFQFPADSIAARYRAFLRESELQAFESGIPLETAQASIEGPLFPETEPDPVVVLVDHKTEDRRYLDGRAMDLLKLCDGKRTGTELLSAYELLHPEDASARPGPSTVEELVTDLAENGFLLMADGEGTPVPSPVEQREASRWVDDG